MPAEIRQQGLRTENADKRVRTYLGGELVADTVRPTLVWEVPYYPTSYFPEDDVRRELLTPSGHTDRVQGLGQAHYFTVKGGASEATDAARHYPDSPSAQLRGLIRFDWDAMDAWFEEDEQVHVHPRDPHHRVDILASSRHVEVIANGVIVASSRHPRLLLETGLPTRHYLPLVDVRMELLRPSTTTTRCAYKGTASYWSVQAGDELFEDLAWTYRTPLPESVKIAGLVCFYTRERVDHYVDGALQQ